MEKKNEFNEEVTEAMLEELSNNKGDDEDGEVHEQ